MFPKSLSRDGDRRWGQVRVRVFKRPSNNLLEHGNIETIVGAVHIGIFRNGLLRCHVDRGKKRQTYPMAAGQRRSEDTGPRGAC